MEMGGGASCHALLGDVFRTPRKVCPLLLPRTQVVNPTPPPPSNTPAPSSSSAASCALLLHVVAQRVGVEALERAKNSVGVMPT